jgi:flavin reductase (DIM6/NTAB) family NADH-FMN oxidoreductase RutF
VREAAVVKVDPATISSDAAYFWQAATILPRPIAWTSTLNEDGSANLAPFSFFTGVSSDPPTCLICVSRRRRQPDGTQPPKDTWRNIERTGEFVIHVVTDALAHPMNVTSRSYPPNTDEFIEAGLAKLPSERVSPPRIAESPVAMECRLERIVEIGRAGTAAIFGEILLWHVRDDLVVNGRLDIGQLDAIGRMSGAAYTRTRDRFDLVRPPPVVPPAPQPPKEG